MKKVIEHNIKVEIKNNEPKIRLEIGYKDNFSDDRYLLKNINSNTDKLMFEILKNNKPLVEIEMLDKNVDSFLNEFLNETRDDDFNKEFKSQILEPAKKELLDFFEFYNDSIVRHGITLEGEIKRMRKMAGI